jgi:hypothetical protein
LRPAKEKSTVKLVGVVVSSGKTRSVETSVVVGNPSAVARIATGIDDGGGVSGFNRSSKTDTVWTVSLSVGVNVSPGKELVPPDEKRLKRLGVYSAMTESALDGRASSNRATLAAKAMKRFI